MPSCSVCGTYAATASGMSATVLHTADADRFLITYANGDREQVRRQDVLDRIHGGMMVAHPPESAATRPPPDDRT